MLLTVMQTASPTGAPIKKASANDGGTLRSTAGPVVRLIILVETVNLKKRGIVMTLHLRIGWVGVLNSASSVNDNHKSLDLLLLK